MNDATWIADLLAHGLIRGSFVPPAPIQALRDLTRTLRVPQILTALFPEILAALS
jgi:hypothetical protein